MRTSIICVAHRDGKKQWDPLLLLKRDSCCSLPSQHGSLNDTSGQRLCIPGCPVPQRAEGSGLNKLEDEFWMPNLGGATQTSEKRKCAVQNNTSCHLFWIYGHGSSFTEGPWVQVSCVWERNVSLFTLSPVPMPSVCIILWSIQTPHPIQLYICFFVQLTKTSMKAWLASQWRNDP